jgi:hypothetical protein
MSIQTMPNGSNRGCWGPEFKFDEKLMDKRLKTTGVVISYTNAAPLSFSDGRYVPASGPDPVRTTLPEDRLLLGGLIVKVPVRWPVTPSGNVKLVLASYV